MTISDALDLLDRLIAVAQTDEQKRRYKIEREAHLDVQAGRPYNGKAYLHASDYAAYNQGFVEATYRRIEEEGVARG